jgi:CheY-like chemotaxis protein
MPSAQKLHILTVEDNPDTQKLLRYMLQHHFNMSFSFHVDEALHLAAEEEFNLFLLDINLGEKRTGVDLLHLLREQPRYANTPALALTAYAMPGDRERFLDAGFNGYISKPFTRRELLDTIKVALNGKKKAS